ncbi:MAG: secretin N-terminal domain-containing protein [Candidatus Polarisedimenticolia bacterium]
MRRRRLLHPIAAAILALLLLPATPGLAVPQGGDAGDAPLGTRVFTLRHKGVDDAYLLVSPRLGPRGSIRAQPHQRTLTVVDAKANLDRMAALLRAFDVPPRSVQVAVQLILASSGTASKQPAPPTIRGVVEKLNALNTRWTDYRLVGDARVLGVEGERTRLQVGDDYRIDFRVDQVSDETRLVRLRPFELQRREAAVEGSERFAPLLSTALNLRDEQLFIVGASRAERSNRALFMTITASVQKP